MASKNTNSIKLTPLIQLSGKNKSSRSTSLFAKTNKTQNIIHKFRCEKSQSNKKRSLFSINNHLCGSSTLNEVEKYRSTSYTQKRLSLYTKDNAKIDLAASVILESFFEAIETDRESLREAKIDRIVDITTLNNAKPKNSSVNQKPTNDILKPRFSTTNMPNNAKFNMDYLKEQV